MLEPLSAPALVARNEPPLTVTSPIELDPESTARPLPVLVRPVAVIEPLTVRLPKFAVEKVSWLPAIAVLELKVTEPAPLTAMVPDPLPLFSVTVLPGAVPASMTYWLLEWLKVMLPSVRLP